MRCPLLSELPPPQCDKTGWPWTEESARLPDQMPDGRAWPRITIVTPSYNQRRFLEETIRSVLLQGYPNLEYVIIDGCSTDGSIELIQKYVAWLRYWVSEPDRGQAHAINKGFALATGDLLGWINSDDLYLPSSLRMLGEAHSLYPRAILAGDVENFHDGEDSLTLVRQSNLTLRNLVDPWNGLWSGHQPGWFAPRLLHLTVGPLDESLRYAFDRDWLCRLLQRADMEYLGQPVARFRIHATAKTTAEVPAAIREVLLVAQRYWHDVPDLDRQYVCAIHGLQEASVYLGDHPSYARFWNRRKAIDLLFSTWCEYPRIALMLAFWKLCLRAVLPRWVLLFRRAVESKFAFHQFRG